MSEQTRKSITASTLSVTIVLALSKVIGFLREAVIAKYFGVSWLTDAYNAAYTLPGTIIQSTITACMIATFIPNYTSILAKNGKKDADRFANNMLTATLLLSLLLMVLVYIFMPLLMQLVAPKFDAQTMTWGFAE